MSLIKVKYDPQPPESQVHEDITMPLINPAPWETDEKGNTNPPDIQQTLVYGVRCPIICINDLVISFDDIIDFELHDDNHIPSMNCHIYDNKNIIQQLVPPSQKGETRVTVQILPPNDKYKKIDIHFIMTNYSVGLNNDLYISATYNLPEFIEKQYKSMGELKLYELYDKIAKEMKLGFATNVEEKEDKRYVFCTYSSYYDTIDRETNNSGEEKVIYNWWIDLWHYLILEDLYERYNTLDSSEDINVWISNRTNDITADTEITPIECEARLTNRFGMENSQLYIKDYRIKNNIGRDIFNGTDKVYSVYSMNDKKYTDTLFIDKDVDEKNIVKNFEYEGEVYGDYDYITNGLYHIPFLQKLNKELIEVDLTTPLLGLLRGKQVILEIYQNSDEWDTMHINMEKDGYMTPYIEISPDGKPTDYVTTEEQSQDESSHFKLDKTISTQYLIMGNVFKYKDNEWTHTVILARPEKRKVNLLK